MESDRPSESAHIVAVLRAAHLFIDDEPKIFTDQFALIFIGSEYESIFEESKEFFQTPQAKIVRSLTLCRSRYTEDLLSESIQRGVRQYVILGAGLDSFAFRQTEKTKKVQIFEIDHPASQKWKQKRLEDAKIPIPKNLFFVPIDFEHQSLAEGMSKSGYDGSVPSFFSWLGVTQFISKEAVFATLNWVATSATAGSEIVFQYCLPDSMLNEEEQKQRAFARQKGEDIGEPWKSTFEPDFLISRLKKIGFDHVENIDKLKAESYLQRYFLDRTDGLEPPFGKGGTSLMRARVKNK